jgi:serine/threonine-protein kinase
MLTGRPPFEGDTAVDIVVKHMREKVPSVCRLRPDLPPDVDVFMQKAMAKLPADRYNTPQEFIAAIDQLQKRIASMATGERTPVYDQKPGTAGRAAQQPQAGRVAQQQPQPSVGLNRQGAAVQQAPQKQARLIVLSNGQVINLTGETMVVGRQDPTLGTPEINLADKTVGRRHAYIRNRHGQYTVEDLNALNKTRLNGVVLTPHEERALKDGDILRFGSVEVRFELR